MAVRSRLLEELLGEEYEFELPISMIDVVFLLLIFFLVASKFKRPEQKLDVNLPRDEGIRPIPADAVPPRVVKIKVAESGEITLDTVPIDTKEQLVEKLLEIRAANTEVNVVIAGEHKAMFHRIVLALDSCMQANIQDVKFQGLDVRGLGKPFEAPPK